jgi:hypothetical protein
MCPWRLYWYFTGFAFLLIVNTLHFPGWNSIFHCCSHMPCLSRSDECLCIGIRWNCQVNNGIISEEPNGWW